MERRQFLLCSGAVATTFGGCLSWEQGNGPDTTTDRTTTHIEQGDNDGGQTETMQPGDQHLVFVNRDDEQHSVQVTVNADDVVFERTVDLAADERRQFTLEIDKPGTYTVSVSVDENSTETSSINFDDYDVQEGIDVFVEISDGRPDIYWQE